ncbi:MAG: Xaa-Pro peptidase family protein [Candidatus Omnitrophota bacterium]
MNSRLKNIYTKLEQQRLDGLIVSLPVNITYLTKYQSRDSYFLVSRKKNTYFTDSRYIEEAKLALKGAASLRKVNGSVFKLIARDCLDKRLGRVAFEERYLPFAEYKKIKEYLGKKTLLVPAHGLIEELRQVKEPEELEKIRKAIAITDKALLFIKGFIAPGKKEIEVAGEAERFIRYQGASEASFDIIVASGPNSSFPHHIPSERKIRNNEPVLVDIGVEYQGYKSDLTRVFFLGKINVLAKEIYDIVLEAGARAIRKIKPGEKMSSVDRAGRQYIGQKGFGGFFGHSLGHGVGLEVHEAPHISKDNEDRLKQGMVFTVEPAVYLPGKFGIRIEDMVLTTNDGCEVLSVAVNK